jgi:membrane-anchored protein YejM (alkaline phosphatase superfamily)
MRSGRRIATLEATVRGLIGILRDLGSDRPFSIVPFEGAVYNNLPDLTSVNNALRSIKYETNAGALDPLRQRVIRPLESLAKRKSLNPTVVVVVTDGDVRWNPLSPYP